MTADLLIQIGLWVMVTLHLIVTATIPLRIGKPRKPLTAGDAAVVLILNLVFLLILVAAAVRL